ncbi:APC family permease [Actinoplanes subtropicus]|jgi:amino acid transporter|uniref:APC family permease n=1 Tax=Actinoplanes subtropicus TaxID=543632 RepID=UPI0004C37248|nr:APC family permease [Actinoplanes subtropicus]
MTTEDLAPEAIADAPVPRATNTLKAGAVGLAGVLFMAVANAAPITAMTGNVPIAVGYGNGNGAPAGFLVATVVLTLFTIGYVSMARYITTAGAFYGFVTHGLGQLWGMATGWLATMAYVVFEGSLIGIFAYFANYALKDWFGWNVNWLLIAVVGIALIAVLGYFDISIAAAVLGFFLICEVVLLAALAFSVLFKGGGSDGLMASSINPVNAFKNLTEGGGLGAKTSAGTLVAAGSGALGLFFAFWSWVGFETTAVYGEESRNPRRIVPRATLIAVIGLGVFYTFVSWMVIAGNGAKSSIELSNNDSIGMFTHLAAANLGGQWVTYVYIFLMVSGSFACALAFHNAASRYLFAIGRELPATVKSLGATHAKHKSPHIASAIQSAVTLVLTVGFYFLTVGGSDPNRGGYIYLYGLLALLGTMAILIVQAITSAAVIWYFHVRKAHPGNWLTTALIPALGGIGMLYVVYLLFSNIDFAGGGAAGSPFFKAIPYVVAATFVGGLGFAFYLRTSKPELYAAVGRTVMEETHERV